MALICELGSAQLWRLLTGDVREQLAQLEDESVQCVVTSPPYFGLRDYGIANQIGLEPSPEAYVAELVAVLRDVRRVLRDNGTLWLNLGDTYASTGASGPHGGLSAAADQNAPRRNARNASRQERSEISRPIRTLSGCKPKDLIGIPWRVAFALQAPDYLGRIAQERDRAWLAALVDGEGCITILRTSSPHDSGDSFPPVLQVRMCDPECVERAAIITGLGNASPRQEPPSQGGNRGSYQWRLNGRKAADTIAEIYPFLMVKRRQAIIAWNHQLVRQSYLTKRGVTVPREAVEKQHACRELIQRLNRREPVDIPSWMQEPPLPVGPGWYLRSDCIWSKPNPMPESVTDRPTKAHEYLFLLSKSASYYYDADSVREPHAAASQERYKYGLKVTANPDAIPGSLQDRLQAGLGNCERMADYINPKGRNRRSVWTVTTQPYKGAHFATFPEKLIEPCILAGSRPGDTVLDPFTGSGTVGVVALRLGRSFIGIDLNPAYVQMARERIGNVIPLLAAEVK